MIERYGGGGPRAWGQRFAEEMVEDLSRDQEPLIAVVDIASAFRGPYGGWIWDDVAQFLGPDDYKLLRSDESLRDEFEEGAMNILLQMFQEETFYIMHNLF